MDAQQVNIRSSLDLSSPPVLSGTYSRDPKLRTFMFLRGHRYFKGTYIKGEEKQLYEWTYKVIKPDNLAIALSKW